MRDRKGASHTAPNGDRTASLIEETDAFLATLVGQHGGIGRLLSNVFFAYISSISTGLRESGFTDIRPVHLKILREIELGGSPLGTIAAKARVTKQAVSQVTKELAALGYVKSMIDPDNRRSRTIIFTKLGLELHFQIGKVIADRQSLMISVIGRDEFARMAVDLLRLHESGVLGADGPISEEAASDP